MVREQSFTVCHERRPEMATHLAGMVISLKKGLGNTPHGWWFRVRERLNRGELEEKEVKAALCALIEEARRVPKAPQVQSECGSARDLWSAVAVYLVGGWLSSVQVSSYLRHLNEFGRFLPFPERVRKSLPPAMAETFPKGAGHGGRL